MIKKNIREEIEKAKKISQEGDTPSAFDLLMDLLFEAHGGLTFEEEIEIVEKAYEYLEKIRAKALALREKAERLLAEGKTAPAFIEAQKSLEIFEKFGTKTSVSLTRALMVKIYQKQEEEMRKAEKK
ncbi:hypothetical protein KJ854_01820 [Patescibacteria group bacterium]|nr:hypothetical protein [Patescibacteria group bacterium]